MGEPAAGGAWQAGSIALWAPGVAVAISGLAGGPATAVAALSVDRPAAGDCGRHSCIELPFLWGQQGRKGRRWGGEGAAAGRIQNYCVSVESDL